MPNIILHYEKYLICKYRLYILFKINVKFIL